MSGQTALQPTEEELRQAALHDNHVGPEQVIWLRASYLFWWIKHGPLPAPLATTGSGTGQGSTEAAIGQPGTQTLLGGTDLSFGRFSGVALDGGLWMNACHTIGLELGGFMLEQRSQGGTVASDATGSPLLARPIFEVLTPSPVAGQPLLTSNAPSRVLVSAPGALTGGVLFSAESRFSGAEANLVRNLACDACYHLDLIGGFRYLDLDENLQIASRTDVVPGGIGRVFLAGQSVNGVIIEDRFRARNQFYGGSVGLRGEYLIGRFSFGASGKVSMGPNHETVEVAGSTIDSTGGQFQPSGLLAVANGNGGRFTDNWFVVVPEVGVTTGFELWPGVRVTASYNFLYISSVMRPGDQVNLNVNPRLVPSNKAFGSLSGPAEPTFPFTKSDFYAHGVQLGMEVAY